MNTCKELNLNGHSLIHTSPNWKQYKCALMGEWINKLWYNPHSGILLLRNKKEKKNVDICNMNGSQKHFLSDWRSQTQKIIFH